jgi:acyl-CoA reductase-like NAD-dependent aldehyde dehydrogenase
MAAHPQLRRVAFTGSAQAALALQVRAAQAGVVKAFTWELGGVNPFIVLPDMAPDVVAHALVGAMSLTSTAGQSCQAMSRLLVPKASFGSVLKSVTERFAALRLGPAYHRGTEMGPLVSAQHRERVGDWVGRAQAEGAHPWAGPGQRTLPAGGYFMAPLVLAGLAPTSRLWATEVFGPLVAATPWEDEDELSTLLSLSCTGLAATVWGQDYARCLEIARRVRAGYVWVNSVSEHVLGMPFGGTGDSGTGREEAQETLLSYSQSRSIVSRLAPGRSS